VLSVAVKQGLEQHGEMAGSALLSALRELPHALEGPSGAACACNFSGSCIIGVVHACVVLMHKNVVVAHVTVVAAHVTVVVLYGQVVLKHVTVVVLRGHVVLKHVTVVVLCGHVVLKHECSGTASLCRCRA
jgi:hypothetical protein